MVIIFDLDDTLFDELSYVRSGFMSVAHFLSPLLKKTVSQIYIDLNDELTVSRSQIFDRLLHKCSHHTATLMRACVQMYRQHTPHIQLFPEAIACLKRFQHCPLYLVTDGNKLVQMSKIRALGLTSYMRRCLCTHSYGKKHAKPSTYCFEKICALEKVLPYEAVYIADNPVKDFVGIKQKGFHTIRVLTGQHKLRSVEPQYNADHSIESLDELTYDLLHTIIN